MTDVLFDSNILIDAYNGHDEAEALFQLTTVPAISVITWMEFLAGVQVAEISAARVFLDRFERLELDDRVMEASVGIRRGSRIKLMDAIILATARVSGRVLVTRNTRDFADEADGVWIPYRL